MQKNTEKIRPEIQSGSASKMRENEKKTAKNKEKRRSYDLRFLVRVFITDLQKDGRTYSFRAGFACDISEKRSLKGNRS